MLALDHLGDGFAGNGHGLVELNPGAAGNADVDGTNTGVEAHISLGGWSGLGHGGLNQKGQQHQGGRQQGPKSAVEEGHADRGEADLILMHGGEFCQSGEGRREPAPSRRISWWISTRSNWPSRQE